MKSGIALIAVIAAFFVSATDVVAAGGPVASTTMPGTGTNPSRAPRPAKLAPFPEISDLHSLKISLRRDACFGTCPSYSVEIAGDGTVTYQGIGYVLVTGRHITHIPQERVHALFEAFRKADFFHLFDLYEGGMTDMPTFTMALSYDGHAMTVVDYVGRSVGMPQEVAALEDLIDKTAATATWVDGDEQTVAALREEGWRFGRLSRENSLLLMRAAENGPDALVEGLLAAGVSATDAGGAYGCRAAASAALRHRPAMLKALLDAGALVYVKAGLPESESGWLHGGACDVLMSAAKGGWPDVIALVLEKHPNVNRVDDDTIPLMHLGVAVRPNHQPLPDLMKSEELLIAAGADINYRDQNGYTPLMMATDDAGMMRVLLKAGVKNIDMPGLDGQTPLMMARNAGVALALLEAGANAWLKTPDGETALDVARDNKHADVEAVLRQWMMTHPAPH